MHIVRRVSALVLTFIVAVVVFAPQTPVAAAPSSWAAASVEEAEAWGLTTDELLDDFSAATTRLEFCLASVNLLRRYGYDVESVTPRMFADTNSRDVGIAAALGITSGTDAAKNTFSPGDPLTREQAAALLNNVLAVIGKRAESAAVAWTDAAAISSWAVQAASDMYTCGVIGGMDENELVFSPKTLYSHEQSIVTLLRMWQYVRPGAVLAPDAQNTQSRAVSNWANVSSVQQFDYMGEGLAYAYIQEGILKITTPRETLNIPALYPLLGDVIADAGGNFYVVWGRANDGASPVDTVFISKFSPSGQLSKTAGFDGSSSPWGDADSAKTKTPFHAGNCVSVISDGVMVAYYAKTRYDGHQSDGAVAVNISDMTSVSLPNDTFSGHSFNQALRYSGRLGDFLFASLCDAYARGIRVNGSDGGYGDENEILFHSYLPANANYDMSLVNRTYAQLGNLAETDAGVALAGASAKSIGEGARTEKQNLFVQIFDPRSDGFSQSSFVGGEARQGATSFDINDNSNSPLTQVTDYGVIWLTDYADKDAIAPQIVAADDKLVVLWSTSENSYYMTLSASGQILTPATSLNNAPLNSFERPVYHNGEIQWAAVYRGILSVQGIKL
jgi:hypothetical protein